MKKVALLFLLFIVTISQARLYTDSNEYSWASSIVDKWSNKGIISGYGDGTFRGNNYLTRAELITILNKINNSDETVNKRPSRDVNEGDWYYKPMAIALNSGLIELDSSGNLKPNNKATREETFVMIAKIFKLDPMNNYLEVLKRFNDYPNINYRNMPYIGAMIKENYINGYEDSTIRAKGYITRAELTSILDNMVGDIFSSGKYSDRIIKGNLVINGEGISLQNVKVEGNIFIMDGTRDNKPLLNNVETSKGIISKVGNIEINDPNESKTLSNISPIGDKTPPVFAKITYTTTCWTNDDITATIRFDNSKTKVVNNSGRKSYIFEDNGEFVFNCEDEEGNNFDFKAKVDNIDKTKPKITIQTESILGGKKISVLIEDDEESPFDGVYYLKGNFSSSYTALRGEYAPNNTFELYEAGMYTIAAEDEAGNITRSIIEINEQDVVNESTTYSITVAQSPNITITPLTTQEVTEGGSITFTITPDSGYAISDVTVDGISVGAVTTYTFNNVTQNHTITAISQAI